MVIHQACCGVALGARHIGVAPCQRETRAGVVVKRGRSPPLNMVAIRAVRLTIFFRNELASVRIGMAGLTLLWSAFEPRFVGGGGLVALAASHRSVPSEQGELGLRMVEAVDVGPRFDVVASFAAERSAVGAALGHALAEFALVRVRMADGAAAIFPTKWQDLVGPAGGPYLVTVAAGNSHVRAGQNEPCIAMLGDRVSGAMEILHSVAILAAILMGRGGELGVMRVLVAVGAIREFYLENRVLPGGKVALRARDLNVLSGERVL